MNRNDKLHVFALFGQSNMNGAGHIDEFVEKPDPRILKMTAEGECEIAKEPLHDWSKVEEIYVVGPGYYFAQGMLAGLEPDVSIGLIAQGRGGTRLAQWEKESNKIYPRVLDCCNNACKKGVLKGVLWHQGESECESEEMASTYAQRFVRFFEQFRHDIGIPNLPVVIGQLGIFLRDRDESPFVDMVNAQLASIPSLLSFSAFVESTGATHIGDLLHFDTRSQKELMAPRYVEAMLKLLKNSEMCCKRIENMSNKRDKKHTNSRDIRLSLHGSADVIRLGGRIGSSSAAIEHRLLQEPFNSLEWLRADLTGEMVSEHDGIEEHPWYRPFKNFSGDISGRYLEVMSLQKEGERPEELLNQLKEAILKYQQPGGYFSASGPIDWEDPIDYGDLYTAIMMPALWGNSRMLCGLVAAVKNGAGNSLEACAKALGDFYVDVLSRFTNNDRMDEYKDGGSFAAGYVTCYFPAIEGLTKLYNLTKDKKYLNTAIEMAEFYESFDIIPIDHSHGMLCCQVGLLLLHEATGDYAYLKRVEKRWDELVKGGYINPAGGILEKCRSVYYRDEGCALTDWLRLNLQLARISGSPRYWDMAERVLYNHILKNQFDNGGFGHRKMIKDEHGLLGFAEKLEEATWCCCYHGLLAFQILKQHICFSDSNGIHLPLAVDFDADITDNHLATRLIDEGPDSSFRYTVHIQKPATLNIRVPSWTGKVSIQERDGAKTDCNIEDGWVRTQTNTTELTLILEDCQHTESHHPDESGAMTQEFCYHGPLVSQGESCSSGDAAPNQSDNYLFMMAK